LNHFDEYEGKGSWGTPGATEPSRQARAGSRRPDCAGVSLDLPDLARRDAPHADMSGADDLDGGPGTQGTNGPGGVKPRPSSCGPGDGPLGSRYGVPQCSRWTKAPSSCFVDPGMSSDPAPQRFHEMPPISHASGCTDSASTPHPAETRTKLVGATHPIGYRAIDQQSGTARPHRRFRQGGRAWPRMRRNDSTAS
jgi:hypothetical protein